MGTAIDKDTWRIVETIIINYETYKERLLSYEKEVILSSKTSSATVSYDDDYTKPQSITELKALKLNNAYYNNLNRKIKAIESAYNMLRKEEQEVIFERFWKYRKKTSYLKLVNIPYSERQMKRIVKKMVIMVAKYLGEIQ